MVIDEASLASAICCSRFGVNVTATSPRYDRGMDIIRDTLKQRRQQLGLTTRGLGAMLAVDQMTISRWERGKREPSYADLQRWGRALGVEIDLVARDPRPGGEVEMTDTQRQALRAFAELLPDLSDEAALDLVGMARHLARRDP
jgi:transcriptional regulator with XRE-family HTH domain